MVSGGIISSFAPGCAFSFIIDFMVGGIGRKYPLRASQLSEVLLFR